MELGVTKGTVDLLSPHRWTEICAALGVSGITVDHNKLLRAWARRDRRYHTLKHLSACLRELDAARHLAEHPAEVELALWFHDAVYRTWRRDNEALSAAWAARLLARRGAPPDVVARISNVILATKPGDHHLTGDAALIVDIDLSILGQPPEIYDEFERNVRREYWWVPSWLYAHTRGQILRHFQAQQKIYRFALFLDRYEAPARANLERAIAALAQQ